MKKIFFKGYYGYENLGDDIFVITAEWICNNLWSNYRPVFVGKKLPRLSSSSVWRVNNSITKGATELFLSFTCNNIVYFGGSLFTNGGYSLTNLKYLIRKNNYLQRKTNLVGVSIGPFQNITDYNSTQRLLSKVNYISVRDYSSKKILKDMNINKNIGFSFDIAILLREIYPNFINEKSEKSNIKIGISLTRNASENGRNLEEEQQREDNLLKTIEGLINDNKQVKELVFFEFNGNKNNGDKEVTEKFYEHFKNKINTKILNYDTETKSMLAEISDCDFILGTRLHSGIIAYSLEIPFILVEYHKKCTEFLNTVDYSLRFDIKDYKSNIKNINDVLKNKKRIIKTDPEIFKSKILEELYKIEKFMK